MHCNEQAIYYKEYLTLKNSGRSISRLSSSLYESKILLNPHQINAAMSFFKNPKRKGLIFADEVGLGKTIEAGLVISQYWYEKKKKIIIISPASLIRQWHEELLDKFHLESVILDSRTLREKTFSWEQKIYITSLNAVYLNKERFFTDFDLVVIDEAHKLRNVYKDTGIMAPAIKEVFRGKKKLLLSATPFQNNLLELFGLLTLIDEDLFPDVKVFKEKYVKSYEINKGDLKNILSNYLVRTLRKDVTKYINYTKRNVLLANYETTPYEDEISSKITNLMYSDDFTETYTLGQSQLLIILLQKLLSSSIVAVTSTLEKIQFNLKNNISSEFDFEDGEVVKIDVEDLSTYNRIKLVEKIESVLSFIKGNTQDSKAECLIRVVNDMFVDLEKDEARNKKILIFTESKKTQEYLYDRLKSETGKKILLFNGENNNEAAKSIYDNWITRQTVVTGSKSVNMRKAVIDAFEREYDILIATDSAAEGLNMQFCSVVINYDLPWNPQKIEQRIGRCHRFGQKNDVIVLNLLNSTRKIDNRIYELLSSKLGIFEETFGSSDMILGNSNISDDIEAAIKNVYKTCRSPEEIEEAFKLLQEEFKEEIEAAVKASEYSLEEYFDTEVTRAFDLQYIEAKNIIDEMEEIFYLLLQSVLPNVEYYDSSYSFKYNGVLYTAAKNSNNGEFCSISGEIGKKAIDLVKPWEDITNQYEFIYSGSNKKIGFIDQYIGKRGVIKVSKVTYDSFETVESLVCSGVFEDGTIIPADVIHKMLKLEVAKCNFSQMLPALDTNHRDDIDNSIHDIEGYVSEVFKEEIQYIDHWADSMIEKIQLEVKELREERKLKQMEYDFATVIDEKAKIQEAIQKISKKINKLWMELAQAEDEVETRRSALILNLNAEKNKSIEVEDLFALEFEIK